MTRLFLLQRATAVILVPLVLGHLALILYAVRGGLSAAEILGRTQGHAGWALFYGLFVLAATVHGTIGVRTIIREWTRWDGRVLDVTVITGATVVGALGLRAVIGVTLP